ncbi:MAG: MBL fold metallo-hydrolase [Candidatus Tectomicrobia bacterium]|nr:MBL fold metallo-hydrolase [Candidatus Tectomicrobia bacterium]
MWLKFWGVRGSIPAPGPRTVRYGGNTLCVEVRCGDTLIIIDAGSGIRELGNALVAAGKPVVAHLLISHTHWDHVQGFPFFVPFYVKGTVLHVYGCRGADKSLEEVLEGQMALPYFPVLLKEAGSQIYFHELDVGESMINDVRVTTIFSNHPGLCLVYRLTWGGKSLVYLSDNEAYHQLAMPPSRENDSDVIGDETGLIDPRLAAFASETDLLIADSPYDAEEYKQRRGWGHSSVDDVVQIALDARAKRLALFHHDPSHSDEKVDEMVAHARTLIANRDAALECFGAQEGMEIRL